MLLITKNLANEILGLINNKIGKAEIITNEASRTVSIVNKTIVDDTTNNELSLNVELYRSEEVAETLTEIKFYDSSNNLIFKTTNLNVNLPNTKVSFIYQIKLIYS
jgi:methionine-rich copper-binding protein CopC